MNDNIKKIDRELFLVRSSINYLDYFNPINYDQEKNKFFASFFAGKKYNPVFKYKTIKYKEYIRIKKKLNEVDLTGIEDKNFKKIFTFYRKDLENRLELFYNIGNDEKIFKIIKKVFGKLDKKLFDESLNNVEKTNSFFPVTDKDIKLSKEEVVKRTKEIFKKNNINWKIKFRKEGALGSVDTAKHILFFKESPSGYSENFFKILIAHEVLGHVRQSIAAEKKQLKIFETGFGYYDLLHEGWALYNEKKENPKIENRLYIYYISTYVASKKSFYETFCFMLKFLDLENAYAMTARVKRSFRYTSIPGSFLKDKAYLEGYLTINNMSDNEIYLVKNAVFDIKYIKEIAKIF